MRVASWTKVASWKLKSASKLKPKCELYLFSFWKNAFVTKWSFEVAIQTAFTRCRHILRAVGNFTVKISLQDFDAIESYLHPKCRSVLFQKRRKLFYFHNFQVFTRCRFYNVPVRVQFSKSTVFKMCRQKMCLFIVNGRLVRHSFHRFQNVPASCEHGLSFQSFYGCPVINNDKADLEQVYELFSFSSVSVSLIDTIGSTLDQHWINGVQFYTITNNYITNIKLHFKQLTIINQSKEL